MPIIFLWIVRCVYASPLMVIFPSYSNEMQRVSPSKARAPHELRLPPQTRLVRHGYGSKFEPPTATERLPSGKHTKNYGIDGP